MGIDLRTAEPTIGAVMATRSDIPFLQRRFVPCLLQLLPLSWILRWLPAFSTQSSQPLESKRGGRLSHSSFWKTAWKFSVESYDILKYKPSIQLPHPGSGWETRPP